MHSEQICDNCKSKDTPLEPIYIIPDNEDSLEEIMDREEEGQLYLCEPCMADLRGEGNIAAVMQDRFKELSRRPWLSSLISEEQPIPKVKLHCYYCSKYACDLDKFIKHLDWHHSVATTAKDNRG